MGARLASAAETMKPTHLPTLIPIPLLLLAVTGTSPAAAQTADPAAAPPEPPPPAAVAPPEPPPTASSWEQGDELFGTIYALNYPSLPVPLHGNRAGGSAGLAYLTRPVVDDGTSPRSLLPFLQRASRVTVGVGGYGWVTRPPAGYTGADRTSQGLTVGPSVDVYVARFLALTAGLSYGYDVLHDTGQSARTHSFGARGGLGLRVGDTRVDLTYTFSTASTEGSFAPLEWGSLGLSAYTVFSRAFSLRLDGNVGARGGGGGAGLGLYLGRDLGLFLDGSGAHGTYRNGPSYDTYGGTAGFSYWVAPVVRMALYYRLQLTHLPQQSIGTTVYGYDQTENGLTVAALARF